MDVFHALSHVHVEERLARPSVESELSPHGLYSLLHFSVSCQHCLSIILRYANNHYHPYIDSTTVLSDSFISISCSCAEECDLLYWTLMYTKMLPNLKLMVAPICGRINRVVYYSTTNTQSNVFNYCNNIIFC